ncbi:PREDICTED: alsin-like isoform X2 [Priapulus caudatus]|uniref:Alsin-like isoform X2 n=1 Tax=Priapulus caudatus TaxID=37621 RepID=A0ABM1F9L9_PRICU|nr:PREDICTED: alsin-like isoform X2 [Priapulus caudatus]
METELDTTETEIDNVAASEHCHCGKLEKNVDRRQRQDRLFLWHGCQLDCMPNCYSQLTSKSIIQVSCSNTHIFVLTSDGQLFSVSKTQQGQLDFENVPTVPDPRIIPALSGRFVTQVDCGLSHSACVCDHGDVFCWGSSSFGQCGTEARLVPVPRQVLIVRKAQKCKHGVMRKGDVVAAQQVACGSKHTMAVSAQHEVWVWGEGIALGLTTVKRTLKPRKIDFLDGEKVLSVACSAEHCLAIVEKVRDCKETCAYPVEHPNRVSTCSICDGEYYTVRDERDTVVISGSHVCPLGFAVKERAAIGGRQQSVSTEDLSVGTARTLVRLMSASDEDLRTLRGKLGGKLPPFQASEDASTDHQNEGTSKVSSLEDVVCNLAGALNLETTSDGPTEADAITDRETGVAGSCEEDNDATACVSMCVPAIAAESDVSHDVVAEAMAAVDADSQPLQEPQCEGRRSSSAFIDGKAAREFLARQLSADSYKSLHKTLGAVMSTVPVSQGVNTVEFVKDNVNFITTQVKDNVNYLTTHVMSSVPRLNFFSGRSARDNISLSSSNAEMEMLTDDDGFSEGTDSSTPPQSTPEKKGLFTKAGRCRRHIALHTEVWSWGKGGYGQLGHGDMLDRPQPCLVRSLEGKNVVKVVAGERHSLALTANCEVFSWGCNRYKQLGYTESIAGYTMSPRQITFRTKMLVWDVAAGARHSLLLADGENAQPQVLVCSKEAGDQHGSKLKSRMTGPVGCTGLEKSCWCRQVFAGRESNAVLAHHDEGGGLVATLHEFAATERLCYHRIHAVVNTLVLPLIRSDMFHPIEKSRHGPPLKEMLTCLQALADFIGRNVVSITRVVTTGENILGTPIFNETKAYISVFFRFVDKYADVISMDGFNFCTKHARPYFEKHVALAAELLGTAKLEHTDLQLLLYLPCHHLVEEYKTSIGKLTVHFDNEGHTAKHLKETQVQLDKVKEKLTTVLKSAEKTKKFWDTTPFRFVETYQTPTRRLLKDSKTCVVSLYPAGGFMSSHWFLLFNDGFLHVSSNKEMCNLPNIWVEPLHDTTNIEFGIHLKMPEDTCLILSAKSAHEKAEWISAFNRAIVDSLSSIRGRTLRLTAPNARHATYTFNKTPAYQGATYTGMWLGGEMSGQGEMKWPDQKTYVGKFKNNLMHGYGILNTPCSDGTDVSEGHWREGKLHGYACIKYANGDIYKGYFKDGLRHGHGCFEQGKFLTQAASIYVGEWLANKKHGYGILDNIIKAEKYMGMWKDDLRQGPGLVVTLDGIYYEGTFTSDKLTGFGLMMFDDNTSYEGEFSDGGVFYGKGQMTLPNADVISGNFTGEWSKGVKINGIFNKAMSPVNESARQKGSRTNLPGCFGKLCVPADHKWEAVFDHCRVSMGCADADSHGQHVCRRAWEHIAVIITKGRKQLQIALSNSLGHPSKLKAQIESLDKLARIIHHEQKALYLEDYHDIKSYLTLAFESQAHPLGKCLESLVDVYRTAYVGVGAHSRLLYHAVKEVRSYVSRLYKIVRLLFPVLPEDGQETTVTSRSVAAGGSKSDDEYCNRKFWLEDLDNAVQSGEPRARLTSMYERYFTHAVESLQHLSTTFCPAGKLAVIHRTFVELEKESRVRVSEDYVWSMDDLFPVFQYVVVRARIPHLGSEIHMIGDLMEHHLQFGEMGIMFTTLQACYFQIQNEKLSHYT